MAETLLTPSAVRLYGRIVAGLSVDLAGARPELGGNRFLRNQLEAATNPRFARIYGFSYEGHYYDLPKPAIFLVHGNGTPASPEPPLGVGAGGGPANRPQATGPTPVDQSGVAAKGWEFSSDVRAWEYDKGDFSIRLDIETGPFDQILLEAMLRPEASQTYASGAEARLRMSGAEARLRMSGAEARLRGNRSD